MLLVLLCLFASMIVAGSTPAVSALLLNGAPFYVALAGSLWCTLMTSVIAWACWRLRKGAIMVRLVCGVLLLFSFVITFGSTYEWIWK
jgi:hypothetical protein